MFQCCPDLVETVELLERLLQHGCTHELLRPKLAEVALNDGALNWVRFWELNDSARNSNPARSFSLNFLNRPMFQLWKPGP